MLWRSKSTLGGFCLDVTAARLVISRSTRPESDEHLIEVRFPPRALGGIPVLSWSGAAAAIIIPHFLIFELVRDRYPHLELIRGRRRSPSGGAPREPSLYGVRASVTARVGRR
jgi:hypothetical protein